MKDCLPAERERERGGETTGRRHFICGLWMEEKEEEGRGGGRLLLRERGKSG